MAENNYVERQRVVRERSNGSLVFIVGGLVVAVAFIIWLFASGDSWSNYSAPTTQPAGDTSITIDNGPDAGAPASDLQPAPVPEADTTAPAVDVEPAPVTDGDAAPATGAEPAAPADPAPAEPAPAD